MTIGAKEQILQALNGTSDPLLNEASSHCTTKWDKLLNGTSYHWDKFPAIGGQEY